jgi:hypothetical protein
MANVKFSELPQVVTVAGTDIVPTVASSTTSKITITDFAKAFPQVSSSISSSYALSASWAPTGSTISASYALSASWAPTGSTISASYASTASYLIGSLQIPSGSSIAVTNTGSTIVQAVSVGTYSRAMSNFVYTAGSGILPQGYSCYSISGNSSSGGIINLYLYAVTDGTSLKNPVYSSPIRIVNRGSSFPITIKPNAIDSASPVLLSLVYGSATAVSSYDLPSNYYIDLCFEPESCNAAPGTIPAGWRIVTTGSIIV